MKRLPRENMELTVDDLQHSDYLKINKKDVVCKPDGACFVYKYAQKTNGDEYVEIWKINDKLSLVMKKNMEIRIVRDVDPIFYLEINDIRFFR